MCAVPDGLAEELERGRESYASRAWTDAYETLLRADRASPLAVEDLDLAATSAYMLGRDDEYVRCLERAHQLRLDRGEALAAARCAFWVAINHILRGEVGRASGWLGRARRLVERDGRDCVEQGYLLLALMFEHKAAGAHEDAIAAAGEAMAIGERFADADLFALAAQDQGLLLIDQGRVAEGVRLLDEAMVAVTAGELSPIVSGFVYCGAISGCQAAYDPHRAQDWTEALTRWCERQPEMVSFSGTCMVHRAEIMQLHGAWTDALEEAGRARERSERAANRTAAAEARYRQGEVLRLQGDFAAAEEAYRSAGEGGREPQPGLALLRLAQGDTEAAAAAIRRVIDATAQPPGRAELLPAQVEIMLASGDLEVARRACSELEQIADRWRGELLAATAANARGAVQLSEGDARAALVALRRARQGWQELEAPYEGARAQVLLATACRALGDHDSATLELESARASFERLGAVVDLGNLVSASGDAAPDDAHGLTPRELEVLRLIASGKSNREIAAELVISEHTVARHAQNIFAKLGLSSRTAASAFAFAHDLA